MTDRSGWKQRQSHVGERAIGRGWTVSPLRWWWLTALLMASALCVTPASGTTYVLMTDEDLVDQASIIAEIDILRAEDSPTAETPSTDYIGIVQRVLKGTIDRDMIVVQVPGGVRPDGLQLVVPGVPRFEAGEKALLFLEPNRNGTYGVYQWLLGSFRLVEGEGGSRLAIRDFLGAKVIAQKSEQELDLVRDYDAFASWLDDRTAGLRRAPDYFRAVDPDAGFVKYTLMEYEGKNVRWIDFDRGSSVRWLFNSSGSEGTLGSFRAALDAWNRVDQTNVRYSYHGTTAARGGFRDADGMNAIIFDDPNGDSPGVYDCSQGGVLASGGWWTNGRTSQFRGKTFYEITEADIVVNDNVGCFLRGNPRGAEELFAHELGHTLGIDHSCGDADSGPCDSVRKDEAVMRAWIHDDQRGAALREDDRAALYELYGIAQEAALEAPSNLQAWAVSSSRAAMRWEDNSRDEDRFEIMIKRAGSGMDWDQMGTVPADSTGVRFDATSGGEYLFKVRAGRGDQVSGWSNVASLSMPEERGLAAPSNLRVSTIDAGTILMSWEDNSHDEDRFEVVFRIEDTEWLSMGTRPANSTSSHFPATPPGTSHFRIRAGRGQHVSDWSNVASLTISGEPGPERPGELPNDHHTMLLLHFNGDLQGDDGEAPTDSAGTSFRAGLVGEAVHVARPGGFIRYAKQSNINPWEGTVEFWLKPDWHGDQDTITRVFFAVGEPFNNGMVVSIDGANNLRFIQWGDDPETLPQETNVERGVYSRGADLVAGQWVHLAVTWKAGAEMSLYRNGELVHRRFDAVVVPDFSGTHLELGASIENALPAEGVLEELRVSSRVRSADEILGGSSSSLAAPSELQAFAVSPEAAIITWQDNSTNEKKFQIFIKVGNSPWQRWLTTRANTTLVELRDAVPGITYGFKVRAKRGRERSSFSNIATVVMPR